MNLLPEFQVDLRPFTDLKHAAGLIARQGPQEHRIDHREHRGIGPDPQRELDGFVLAIL